MIKEQRALTYSEVLELIGDGDKSKKVKEFIKEYYKLKPAEATKMKEELIALNLIKLKEEYVVNIVNLLPQDASDVMKILPETSLDQEEINKILDIVKKY